MGGSFALALDDAAALCGWRCYLGRGAGEIESRREHIERGYMNSRQGFRDRFGFGD